MQVDVEDVSSVKKIMHIEVPEEVVTGELDKAYSTLKKTAKVKGFRPGKAPKSLLRNMYKKDVHADVTSNLIQNSFVDALKETKLKVLGNPKIDPPALTENAPFKYDAIVEVSPELERIDYKELKLTKNKYRVTDEEIEAQIEALRKNLAQHKTIKEDRPVQQDDFVVINYEGFKGGKPFKETQSTENHVMKIGQKSIAEELDNGIIDMKVDDKKDIKVNFPKDHFNTKLAGNDISFAVTLTEIREEILPEVDDEMAKDLGEYETIKDLKDSIIGNLEQGYANRVEQELNEQVFQNLIKKTEFEVPEVLIEHELESIVQEAERTYQYYNISLEQLGQTRDELKGKYQETAEKQVRRYLILSQIIQQDEMSLSDEEMKAGFEDMSKASNQSVEEIGKYYEKNADRLDYFKHALLEKKAIKLIIDNSEVTEVEPELEKKEETEKEK